MVLNDTQGNDIAEGGAREVALALKDNTFVTELYLGVRWRGWREFGVVVKQIHTHAHPE